MSRHTPISDAAAEAKRIALAADDVTDAALRLHEAFCGCHRPRDVALNGYVEWARVLRRPDPTPKQPPPPAPDLSDPSWRRRVIVAALVGEHRQAYWTKAEYHGAIQRLADGVLLSADIVAPRRTP